MTEYNAARIQVPEGLEAVRRRPGMYVGSTEGRGLHAMVHELVETAANEVLQGRASRVAVTLTADGGVQVSHDGAQPYDRESVLTTLAAPWHVSDRRQIAGSGTCPAAANALSARLIVEEHRDGVAVHRAYVRGGLSTGPTGSGPADRTGTTITLHPDPEIFETVAFDRDTVAERLRELAFLNRELDLTLTDERTTPPRTERFHHPAGPADFTTHLGGDPAETLVVETEDARMGGTLDVALSWTGRGGVHGYANSRRTEEEDSTHLQGFHRGLAAALGRSGPPPGLTAVVSVKLDAPELNGATRRRLDNEAVLSCTAEAVQRTVEAWLAEHPERAAELAVG
ncbi:DNA gyrase subunit B [Kitasatospora sp. NPDC001540]|uniref:DNA gyrase subunit B n=1 Tax=Kitasatospora sp. NPDC001540 TaxID=3364014 RepID=UPI0036B46926